MRLAQFLSFVWLQLNAGMKRALEAFQEAILMVDASSLDTWTVLHVNSAFLQQTGAPPVFSSACFCEVLRLTRVQKWIFSAMWGFCCQKFFARFLTP